MKTKHLHPSIKSLALGLVAAAALASGNTAQAALVFTITEQLGGGVNTTYSGSLLFDLADAQARGNAYGETIVPNQAGLQVGPTLIGYLLLPIIQAGGPASFGPGGVNSAATSSGDTAGINGSLGGVLLPTGYVSGATISGTSFYDIDFFGSGDPATLANLGLTAGTYVWNTQSGSFSDTITLNIIPAVPEPSTFALLGLAGLGLGLLRRRR
jgi:hypothetical protein